MADKNSEGTDRHTFRRGGKDQGHRIAEALYAAGKKDRDAVQRAPWKAKKDVLQALLLLFFSKCQEKAEEQETCHRLPRLQACSAADLQELKKNQDETCAAVRLQ